MLMFNVHCSTWIYLVWPHIGYMGFAAFDEESQKLLVTCMKLQIYLFLITMYQIQMDHVVTATDMLALWLCRPYTSWMCSVGSSLCVYIACDLLKCIVSNDCIHTCHNVTMLSSVNRLLLRNVVEIVKVYNKYPASDTLFVTPVLGTFVGKFVTDI